MVTITRTHVQYILYNSVAYRRASVLLNRALPDTKFDGCRWTRLVSEGLEGGGSIASDMQRQQLGAIQRGIIIIIMCCVCCLSNVGRSGWSWRGSALRIALKTYPRGLAFAHLYIHHHHHPPTTTTITLVDGKFPFASTHLQTVWARGRFDLFDSRPSCQKTSLNQSPRRWTRSRIDRIRNALSRRPRRRPHNLPA